MTTGTTYEGFGMGNHTQSYTGYTLPTVTDWQNTSVQQAYIWFVNFNDGVDNLDVGWSSTNCCFFLGNGLAINFGGVRLQPYDPSGATRCNQPGGHVDARYHVSRNSGYEGLPLPGDYFTTYPATESASCGLGNNPGLFMRSYQ
jgi:hypothetical protein